MRLSRFRAACASAAFLLSTSVHAAPDAASPGHDEKAGAQKTFEAGTKLYDARRYKEALSALRASYQILPSPNSHLMIARCLRELGSNKEAYREFLAVAAEARDKGDKYAAAAAAAGEEGDELRQRIGFVTVHLSGSTEGAKVKVADEPVDSAELANPIPVDPATILVTAEGVDGSAARAEVAVAAGASQTVELTLAPPPKEAPPPAPEPPKPVVDTSSHGIPLRTWAYVAGGVGVVGLATFAVFGSMSNSKYNDLSDQCNGKGGPCSQDDIDAGKRDQTIANVGLVVGIVGLGAGTALFFLGGKSRPSEGGAASALHVNVGARSILVRGSF